MTESKIRYAYSHDEEIFHDDLTSAIDAAQPDEDQKSVNLYRGEIQEQGHERFICANWIVEDMQNRAMDNCGEFAETYLDDIDKEKTDALHDLILKWLNENAEKPTFYMVSNVQPYETDID